MGAIHELRADYRHYRLDNPQYRVLFITLDILALLLKLAFFVGFLSVCWTLVNRSSLPPAVTPAGNKSTQQMAAPELSQDRIALLQQIAGQSASDKNEPNIPALVRVSVPAEESEIVYRGSYLVSEASSSPVVGSIGSDPVSTTTVAQVPASSPPNTEPQTSRVVLAERSDTLGRSWVQQQPSGNYTIQLALTANRPFLESFADKLPGNYASAIYPERRTADGMQYSLSLGNFPDRPSAESALASLPKVHKRYGAHLRRFDEIQDNLSSISADTVR